MTQPTVKCTHVSQVFGAVDGHMFIWPQLARSLVVLTLTINDVEYSLRMFQGTRETATIQMLEEMRRYMYDNCKTEVNILTSRTPDTPLPPGRYHVLSVNTNAHALTNTLPGTPPPFGQSMFDMLADLADPLLALSDIAQDGISMFDGISNGGTIAGGV